MVPPGILPGTEGCVCHLGARDGCQSAGAPHAGQLDSVTTMCVDPIASLVRDQRRGDHPAGVALLGKVAFVPERGKGSHGTLYYGEKRAIVRNPKDALKTGTLHAMLTQLGLTLREL